MALSSVTEQPALTVIVRRPPASGFKIGANLGCEEGEAVYLRNPKEYRLPAENASKDYILAKDDYYFVYPNDFYKYKRQFQGGFQHGGISMGELITPVVTLTPRL